MASPETPREPITPHVMADLMLRTALRNSVAHHRDGVPISSNFEMGRNLLQPTHIAEEVASSLRTVVVSHAAGAEPPHDVTDEAERMHVFRTPPVEDLETELAYMEAHADRESFSSMALLADLYKAAGYHIEAVVAYEQALKAARVHGGVVTE